MNANRLFTFLNRSLVRYEFDLLNSSRNLYTQSCVRSNRNNEFVNTNKTSSELNRDHGDWVGPPDPDSNLRPFKFHKSSNETPSQKRLRLLRTETQEWNQEFWSKHNTNFRSLKEEFIRQNVKPGENPKPEQMAIFYRKFLSDNYKMHCEYNREWYKRNIGMLWPALVVKLEGLFTFKKL